MTSAQAPLLPWILLDPTCPEWAGGASSWALACKAADLIRNHCSVVIGADDLEHLVDAAKASQDSVHHVLFEALNFCPRRVRGRTVADVPAALQRGDHEAPVFAAIVDEGRSATALELRSNGVRVVGSASEFFLSDLRDRIEDARHRVLEPRTTRDEVWNEILEPFTRVPVLNIHESFIFNVFALNEFDFESSGLCWFLDRLSDRSKELETSMTVVVRGGFDHDDRNPLPRYRIHERCDQVKRRYAPTLRLHFEPVQPRRSKHDRYMIARRPNNDSALLSYTYPIISEFGQSRFRNGAATRGGRGTRDDVIEFFYATAPQKVAVRVNEWLREKQVLLSR